MELSPSGQALVVILFVPVGIASFVALGALKVLLARWLGEDRAVKLMVCAGASLPVAGITYAVLAGAATTSGFFAVFGGITLGCVTMLGACWETGVAPRKPDATGDPVGDRQEAGRPHRSRGRRRRRRRR